MKRIFVPVIILSLASLVTLAGISQRLFLLQLAWILAGAAIVFGLRKIDWRAFFNHRGVIWGFYGFCLLLLFATYLFAPEIRNTRSWLVIGPFTLQPVELVKLSLILVYAHYFSRRHLAVARWKNILASFLFFALPAGFVALQPDMGSALVLFGIWFGFLLVSGLPPRRIIAAVAVFALVGILGWSTVLKDYQRERILGVFYPERNALSINYSTIQSKIAIGSAGLFGKGFGQGSQTQLGFLTEPATDFILAAFIEEWGILLGVFVLGVFIFMLLSILRIGMLADQNFEKFAALGTAIVFGLHFMLNAGSVIGIFPVVGVTFPFLSYGGSSLLTNFFLLAIINTIVKRT